MKRTAMKRATKPMARTAIRVLATFSGTAKPLKRTRLRPVSKKTRKARPAFDAVYRAVDARSLGMCELVIRSQEQGAAIIETCPRRFAERHHTVKPRRAKLNHVPERVIALCAEHHARCEGEHATFAKGRLVILPNGDGTFRARYCYAKAESLAFRAGARGAPRCHLER